MNFRKNLFSLVPGNKAPGTDRDAPQLGNDRGMHLLYDGTKAREDQSMVEEEEHDQPCLEPVEYARTCPR